MLHGIEIQKFIQKEEVDLINSFFYSGFFFSHVGWLLCVKHPEVKSKGKGIDISDLVNDPVLHFQNE